MSEPEDVSRAFLPARALCLAPYALVLAWPSLGATHALMLGLLGELLFPRHTEAVALIMRHFVAFSILRMAAPDPFPWWWGMAFLALICLTHAHWSTRPRLCAWMAAALLVTPLADMWMRLDPEQVEGAGSRNLWMARGVEVEAGTVALLDAEVLHPEPFLVVLPQRPAPWYLHAGASGKGRVGLILGFALVFGLIVARKPGPFQLALLFPWVLGTFLLRPGTEAEVWLGGVDGRWQVLTLELPLAPGASGDPPVLRAEFPPPRTPEPGPAVSWVLRGPLSAPKEGGEGRFSPLLTHWADARPAPEQFGLLESGLRLGARQWEIDSEGVLVLRALP